MIQVASTGKPILIFPAGMPRSIEYLEQCLRNGQPVLGSSSVAYDVAKARYPVWAALPYITDPAFNDALVALIAEHDIAGIYTPNLVAWSYLNRVLKVIAPSTPLVNGSPTQEEVSGYHAATRLSQYLLERSLSLASGVPQKPSATELELSTLFRHASIIPGMCDDEKIGALCEIARHSVQGDIVEIGSAYGKSAFVLSRLARLYDIGNTLCVDPWKNENLVQHDKAGLVDTYVKEINSDEILRVFEMSLLPYSNGNLNYLRLPSTQAVHHYSTQHDVTTSSFGTTAYCGKIAILHVDGNHSYDAVRDDVAAWSSHVTKGGWIIIDDYVWPYGDGPQRVGDDFFTKNKGRINCAFVMGTALFLQLH